TPTSRLLDAFALVGLRNPAEGTLRAVTAALDAAATVGDRTALGADAFAAHRRTAWGWGAFEGLVGAAPVALGAGAAVDDAATTVARLTALGVRGASGGRA